MFAVIYRFHLKPYQEDEYQKCWHKVASYFIQNCGAIGSCLHKSDHNLWIAYSRWPDKVTRDALWPSDGSLNEQFPEEITKAIKIMQDFKKENQSLKHYDEICMDIVDDLI
jgi:hypothetical protein